MATEPVVRIRCAGPEDEARIRRALAAAGLAPETSLTRLFVRDADPDQVHRLLVSAGAAGRVTLRESVGKLIGWLIDRRGDVDGRGRSVKAQLERALADAGLADRYAAREDEALVASARRLYGRIVAEGAPFVPWEEFRELFLVPRAPRAP